MRDPGALVVAPVLIPLIALVTVLLVPPAVRRMVSLAGHLALTVVAAVLVVAAGHDRLSPVAFGGWSPPFAIVFQADRLSAVFVVLTALAALASALADRVRPGDAEPPYALVHGFVAGACGAFLTGDVFNLYVWFEVVLLASLGLVAWGRTARSLDAALRYLVLNVVGTLMLLAAVGGIYAVTGHLDMSAVRAAAGAASDGRLTPLLVVFATACLVKAAAFPVFAWLPPAYDTLPPPRTALLAAVGTKLGVYALLRLPATLPDAMPPAWGGILGWIAVVTMVTGVLGAAYHWDIRRILAFHSVSQVGYMLLGLALGTAGGAQAAVVFALHHGLVKASLFHVAGLVRAGGGSYDLRRTGGLATAHPWLAAVFLSQALALVGVPPLSGFWAKLLLLREVLSLGRWTWAAIALGVGLLTLYSMLKIWVEAFWKPHPDERYGEPRAALAVWPFTAVAAMAALVTAAGLWPDPVVSYVGSAVSALWEPTR